MKHLKKLSKKLFMSVAVLSLISALLMPAFGHVNIPEDEYGVMTCDTDTLKTDNED